MSLKKLKSTVQAEINKEAQKVKKAVEKAKAGVKGAAKEAGQAAEDMAKNTACAPLIPMLPAMLYLLKKEKNITFSASDILTKRYKVVESFYKNIVLPYNKKGNLEASFDMVEMSLSDFEHLAEEAAAEATPEGEAAPTTESAIGSLLKSAVEGGAKGAKVGAAAGTALAAAGVPPPISNIAGATAGAQLGAMITAVLNFFKLGLEKVKTALAKTQKQADDLSAGLPISPNDIKVEETGSSFDFKKLLLPIVALVAIYFLFIKK